MIGKGALSRDVKIMTRSPAAMSLARDEGDVELCRPLVAIRPGCIYWEDVLAMAIISTAGFSLTRVQVYLEGKEEIWS